MNQKPCLEGRGIALPWPIQIAVAGILSAAAAFAQIAPPTASPAPAADNEEVIELSPFEIVADKDNGNQARSTLAGSRLNADLQNVPAQITVMTKDFLEDIAAGSLEDALPYSLNVEGISEFSSAEAGRGNFIDNLNDGQSSCGRGLTGVGATMNFFRPTSPSAATTSIGSRSSPARTRSSTAVARRRASSTPRCCARAISPSRSSRTRRGPTASSRGGTRSILARR